MPMSFHDRIRLHEAGTNIEDDHILRHKLRMEDKAILFDLFAASIGAPLIHFLSGRPDRPWCIPAPILRHVMEVPSWDTHGIPPTWETPGMTIEHMAFPQPRCCHPPPSWHLTELPASYQCNKRDTWPCLDSRYHELVSQLTCFK